MSKLFKNVLISVSDKKGIDNFAKEISNYCEKIISTGGTAKLLKNSKIKVTEIDRLTGFPEILDGRVKTLNPKIHGGILAVRKYKKHVQEMKKYKIEPIDMVVVNLYPFEETIRKKMTEDEKKIDNDVIENIDIGGVTLLRAAAKNFEYVLVVCDPEDYDEVLRNVKNGTITSDFRMKLSAKAFRHTAYYDSIISNYFSLAVHDKFPEKITIGIKKIMDLRYGENSHQQAAVYSRMEKISSDSEIAKAKQLQGKELSYNNYLDLDAAFSIVKEFEKPACVIVKHNNPCGVAEGRDLLTAYKNALMCDPVSAFGGIIAFNRVVDEETAEEVSRLFVECIVSEGFTDGAIKIFKEKKNLRLLTVKIEEKKNGKFSLFDYRTISGGMLVMDKDTVSGLENLKIVTKRSPSEEELESLKFAWKVAKYVKSNAIVLVRGNQTVGIGAGQMSRIDALFIALRKMKQIKDMSVDLKKKPLVLASDAFFPFPDVPIEAAKEGITAIIQPGGSLKDDESIKVCNENNITMVFTGIRHFRH